MTIAHRVRHYLGQLRSAVTSARHPSQEFALRLEALEHEVRRLSSDSRQSAGYLDAGTQLLLSMKYREEAEKGVIYCLRDVEFKNYSQSGEDGILMYVFALIGTTNRQALEICAGNGKECNSANLILNHGWTGLLFDGDANNIAIAREFFSTHPNTWLGPQPVVCHAWITAENINTLVTDHGMSGEIDLLSLDLDGIDLWVWQALTAVSPRVVILEIQAAWLAELSVSSPYSPHFIGRWTPIDDCGGVIQYGGASLQAFVKIAKQKGYRLIGGNRLNHNVVFMREDVGTHLFPEVAPASIFTNPEVKAVHQAAVKALSKLPLVDV